MNNYKELWKPIRGYESLYKVSNLGNVFSIRRNIILKPIHNGKKYCYVILQQDKHRKQLSIHRLVANHFIPNIFNKPQVNHKDGNKSNNKVDNLEWCTNNENYNHAVENDLIKVGLGSKKEFDIDGIIYDYVNLGYSIDRINKKYNVSKTTTDRIFKEYSIKKRTIGETRILKTPINKKELEMKIIEGLTNEELAIWFKTSPATIKRRMVLYQINKKKLKKSVEAIYESLNQ